jgi:maleate cis-trans isomerase
MDARVSPGERADRLRHLGEPRARVGLIIPSVNRMSEPQFNYYAPPGLGIFVSRGRVVGKEATHSAEALAEEIARAAARLADASPDLIVFHCTATSMRGGPQGETEIIDLIERETGIATVSTSRMVGEALRVLGITKAILLTPYQSNDDIINYLSAVGCAVVRDVALGLTPAGFEEVTPQRWVELAQENDCPEADGVFLSCTNTTQIEAIADIERVLGKPVVNSNQAVLWGCIGRFRSTLGHVDPMPELGRLMATNR